MTSNVQQYIDWNQMSELGLIRRINSEILHPLGLAISRNPEDGTSKQILVADDGEWKYANAPMNPVLTDEEIRERLGQMEKSAFGVDVPK